MNRSLLIAALATLAAGSSFAQSNVTIYGRLNTSVERQKDFGTVGTRTELQNNGSRIGFRGTEDLGGGLKAGFVLEHRFNVDTGTATNPAFWGGAGSSEVNLGGGFGMVRLGHFTSEAYFATSDATDLLNHGTGTSSDALYKYLNNDNNKVAYRTPSLGGATVELAVLAAEGAVGAKTAYDVAANYTVGPLGLGAGFERGANSDTQFAFRALYDIAPFIVTGYVQRFKSEVADDSKTIARVSAQYNIGAAELHAAVGAASALDSAAAVAAGVAEPKMRQYTVGANYNLSKRTKLFGYYNRVSVSGPALDPSALAVGIRHNF